MLNDTEIQQESAPTKKRIGRARFLLEFFIAAAFVKVGSEVYSKATSGVGVFLPLSVFGLGFFLAIWASIRRLRDIKRSEWWATVLIAPLLLGIILGIVIMLSGSGITDSAYVKTVGIAYMIVYLLFLGVLLFWPSAFPKGIRVAAMTGKQPSIEADNRENEIITTDQSVCSIADKCQGILRMNRLNGWQRLWVLLTILWLPTVAFLDYRHWPSQDGERVAGCVVPSEMFSYSAPAIINEELTAWRQELPTNLVFNSEEQMPPVSESAYSVTESDLRRIFGPPLEEWFPKWRGDPLEKPEWSKAQGVKPYCKNLLKRLELSGRAEQMRDANSKAMLMPRIKWIALEIAKWIVPAVGVYLLGLAIVWVSRGFRKSPRA